MVFSVVIVGRPNVGKSTLFNRLTRRRAAIVDDTPGVTRDRREGDGQLGSLRFRIIDTAGLEDSGGPQSLAARMTEQTMRAVNEADLALLLVDGRAGINPTDKHFCKIMHEKGKKTVLIVSKCEGRAGDSTSADAWGLGFGQPIKISAEHAEGLGDLFDSLLLHIEAHDQQKLSRNELPSSNERQSAEYLNNDSRPLDLAIVGRPNVGKSTLLNRICGEDRVITGPEVGLTRDSISVKWSYCGREVRLVDTAGMRKRSKVIEGLEKLSTADARRSMGRAQVVMLIFDGSVAPLKQDFSIASMVVKEGRAPVIVLNKWDCVDNPQKRLQEYQDSISTMLSQAKGIPIITLSALNGIGVKAVMPTVLKAYERWNRRVPTAALNRWLADVLDQHPPPLVGGRRIKLRYVTQAKARPPTFAVFCNFSEELPDSYSRYLVNNLREAFDLPGVPIRLVLRKRDNPYIK